MSSTKQGSYSAHIEGIQLKNFPSNSSRSTGSRSNSISSQPVKDHRRRRSSSIISHVEQETFEDDNDQRLLPNMNATWVSQRGAWIIHLVIIVLLKVFFNLFPGINNEVVWTLTNMTYVVGSYVMFHMIKGTPFEFNGGAYDNLTMWEQIDGETLYTPSRKFLTLFPIALFLVATQSVRNNFKLFMFNLVLTSLVAILPKVPFTHRLRISIPIITGPQQIS